MARLRLLPLLLPIALLPVYAQSLGNGFVMWDDDELITENPVVQSFSRSTVRAAFSSYDPELYVPLTVLTYQAEHALFGFRPFFFHLTNLVLHGIASILVFLILRRLLSAGWRPVSDGRGTASGSEGIAETAAFLCAFLFALHPLNTEAVAWASARKDVLMGVFALASLLSHSRWRETGRGYRRTFAFLLLALLAKPAAVVLPFAFLLFDWKEGRGWGKKAWREYAPFLLLGAAFLLVALLGKGENLRSLSPLQTALLSAKSVVLSSSLFFYPRFSLLFLQATPVTLRSAEFFLPPLLLFGAAMVAWRSLRRTRDVAFGLGLVALFLLPSFATFSKAGAVYVTSDRYMYLAQVGFLFLLGTLLMRLFHSSRVIRNVTVAAVAVVLVLAGWGARRRSLLWRTSETLFMAALARNPSSAALRSNMGVLREQEGDLEGARRWFEDALRVRPSFAPALYGLGNLAQARGEWERALALYREATGADPRYIAAYNALGSLLQDRGDLDGAIEAFRGALAVKPNFAQARINLADAYGKKGMYREGLLEYKRVMEINPEFRQEILRKVPQLEQIAL